MIKLIVIIGTIYNVLLAEDLTTFFSYQLVLAGIAVVMFFIVSLTSNQNDDGTYNPPKILKKKMIDEHIKLVLQNSYASAFLLEQTKVTGSIRDTADDQVQFHDIVEYIDTLTTRDFTSTEIDTLLDMNKSFRRRFDAVKENKNLGSFDNIFNPSYLSQTTWDFEIDEFKKEMKWDYS